MEKFRINNDLSIFWSITEKDGSPYTLSDKTVRLFVTSPRGRMDVTSDITVQDNVICWLFRGSRQRYLGTYKITVEIQASPADRTIRKDIPEAFELVSSTQYEQTEIGRPDINEEGELTLATSLDIFQIKPIIPQVGPNRNWWVDGADTGKSSVGLTAYEFAKEQGYEGTEEEYTAECLAVPVLNAESREATEAATIAAKSATDASEEASTSASKANTAAASANEAAEKANEAAGKAEETIEAFGPAIANKADKVQFDGKSYVDTEGISTDDFFYSMPDSADGTEDDIIATKNYLKKINGQELYGRGDIAIEGAHNIGSIDLFEQIIAERRDHNLTQEDKDAILSGKIITTSAGNVVVPTISSNSMGENAAVLIFHFNERLYEMFVIWNDTRCYINGVLSFTKETKLYADSELSETSENSVQNKVVTEKLTELSEELEHTTEVALALSPNVDRNTAKLEELSEENKRLKERIEEQDVFIEDLEYHKLTANSDNRYPDISVGTADNLAGVDVVDSEINFRRSGGGAISDGVARIESIKGNSVVWNQCYGRGSDAAGTWEGNIVTINGVYSSETRSYDLASYNAKYVVPIANHKYYVSIEIISGTIVGDLVYIVYPAVPYTSVTLNESTKVYQGIISQLNTNLYWFVRTKSSGSEFTNVKVRHVVYDLTQMFGAGNEPTTIEEFYARLPMGVDLNAYNEGEVIHMDVQSIESVGVNQWDEEVTSGAVKADGTFEALTTRISTSLFEVLPNKTYYLTGPSSAYNGRYVIYDENKRVIYADINNGITLASKTFTTPSNAKYACITFGASYGTTYNHDICINLSDTSINGKYYPYIKRQEDLSLIRKYFPNGMKSAGSAHDEIRYNKASGKKEYSKGRLKSVDLGSLTYSEWQDGMYATNIADMAIKGEIICAAYPVDTYTNITAKNIGIASLTDKGGVVVYDSAYTTPSAFKAAMQGVILYYEAAEWEWVELDKEDQLKDLDYQVWNFGTEKAIAEGKSAPLAADITYGFNAIGKIKELESLVAALRAKVGI